MKETKIITIYKYDKKVRFIVDLLLDSLLIVLISPISAAI